MSPASAEHQDLLRFILTVVGEFVDTHDLGRVLFAPFLMRLVTRPSGREPDLLFVSNDHLDRLKPGYLDGTADVAVEIISPEHHARPLREAAGSAHDAARAVLSRARRG